MSDVHVHGGEALVIRPGDKILLRVPNVSSDVAQVVKDRLGDVLGISPTDVVVIGCDQIAVYRPQVEG